MDMDISFGGSSTLGFITVDMIMVYTAQPVHFLHQNRLEGKILGSL